MKVYVALVDFQLVTSKKITIYKDQKIPENFFAKSFIDPKTQIDRLVVSKKMAEVNGKEIEIEKPADVKPAEIKPKGRPKK